jgi:hypothetical protein
MTSSTYLNSADCTAALLRIKHDRFDANYLRVLLIWQAKNISYGTAKADVTAQCFAKL